MVHCWGAEGGREQEGEGERGREQTREGPREKKGGMQGWRESITREVVISSRSKEEEGERNMGRRGRERG